MIYFLTLSGCERLAFRSRSTSSCKTREQCQACGCSHQGFYLFIYIFLISILVSFSLQMFYAVLPVHCDLQESGRGNKFIEKKKEAKQ